MRIIIVDPWGINGLDQYIKTFLTAFSDTNFNILFITNSSSPLKSFNNVTVQKSFFSVSQKMKNNMLRKVIRFMEYVFTTVRLVLQVKNTIVHFQWFLVPFFDLIIIKLLKLRNCKIYYTAHNAKPHNKTISKFQIKIYHEVDKIFVHGLNIKNDIISLANISKLKFVIIPHGNKLVDDKIKTTIPAELNEINFKSNLVFSFLGQINKNKGVDKLLEMWFKIKLNNKNTFLLIAGKVDKSLRKKIYNYDLKNCLIIDRFLSNEEFTWVLKNSNLILLPYYSGSVSGVFFSAASHKLPVLTTDFGSISDYIIDKKTSFISKDFIDFEKKLKILSKKSKDFFLEIGIKNYNHVSQNFNSDVIRKK